LAPRPEALEYPALYQLFGAYLNEDYRSRYGSLWAALDDFARRRQRDLAPAAAQEVDKLLALPSDERQRVLGILNPSVRLVVFGSTLEVALVRVRDRLRDEA
jgi:hypothetical protein